MAVKVQRGRSAFARRRSGGALSGWVLWAAIALTALLAVAIVWLVMTKPDASANAVAMPGSDIRVPEAARPALRGKSASAGAAAGTEQLPKAPRLPATENATSAAPSAAAAPRSGISGGKCAAVRRWLPDSAAGGTAASVAWLAAFRSVAEACCAGAGGAREARCGDGSGFVRCGRVADGIADCADGSDEMARGGDAEVLRCPGGGAARTPGLARDATRHDTAHPPRAPGLSGRQWRAMEAGGLVRGQWVGDGSCDCQGCQDEEAEALSLAGLQ